MTSSTRPWLLVAFLLGGVLGSGTSQLFPPSASAPPPSAMELQRLSARLDALSARLGAPTEPSHCVVSAPAMDLQVLRAELRQALREERAAALGASASPPESEPVPPREEPPPQALAQLERGQRLLDDALRAKRWGDAQVDELHSILPELLPAQRQELLQKLAASINRGELSVETSGMPL